MVRVPAERAADVNQLLASAGIWASALQPSSDLDSVVLSLTAAAPAPSGPLPAWEMPRPGDVR